VAQVIVQHLPSKLEVLVSNPSTARNEKKKKKGETNDKNLIPPEIKILKIICQLIYAFS
jgi:hypothetical protein